MQITTRKTILWIACAAILQATVTKLNAQGTWTAVTTATHTSGGGMILLSDGTVLCKTFSGGSDGYGNTYDKLTPNSSGSYSGGTWSSIAPMANTRLYYSSQILKDGRLYVAGGEYGTGGSLGEVYNPLTNTWTSNPAPGATVSDANSEILENGKVLQATVTGSLTGTKIYDPATNTYAAGPTALGIHNESAWVKLPDNSILYVNRLSTSSERYIPATNTWIADATVPVQLYDAFGDEAGGALLLPDGRAFFLGSSGHNAYYTPSGTTAPGTWAAAPDFPNAQGTPDAPAAMMVNGKVLCNASPVPTSSNHFPSPTTFYEFDPVANSFTAITAPGGGATLAISTYITNMLALPNGQVLYSRQNSNQYYVYTPGGSPVASGKPTVGTVTQTGTYTYQVTGTLFNGISQGATYGDDWQMNSNYPIVRLVNGSNVYYARTSNWNSTGVRRGSAADTATFTIPSGLPNVPYSLYVVANGIASDPASFSLTPTAFVSIAISSGTNPSCSGASVTFTATPTNGGTTPFYQWKVNGSNVGTNNATYTTTGLTTGQIVTCVMTSNLAGVLGNPATSTGITMTVNTPSAAAVSIAGSATTICSGASVTFTATPANGGTSPSYQWKVDGVNAGTNSAIFTTTALTNGQVVTCVMTSNSTCVTIATATSNSITMTVNSNASPSVNIAASSNPVCTGTQVLFTATPTNGGLQPSYQWKINGVNAGTNSSSYSTTGLTNGQVVTCVLSANAACPATATLGTSPNTNATTSDLGAAYPTYYGNGRQQYLVKASELTALGLSAGNITSIGFTINGTTGDPATLFGYTIKMAATSVTALTTTFQAPAFTTVFGPANYSPVLSSLNTHTLSTPFAWNGTSNILVDICFSNQVTGNVAYQSLQSSSSFVSTSYYQADGTGGSGACSQATASATGSVRPNMIFTNATAVSATSNSVTMTVNALPTVTASNVSGCAGSSIALSGTPAGGTWSVANPYTGSSTTYTHTYTDGNGCTNTSAAANITVNPLPTVTASNVSGCAGSSIALSGTPAGGTWSVANPYTGSSTTYTHTFTDQNGCTNTSAAANITVNPLPTVTASNVSGCAGSSIALSGTPAGGTWSVANPYTGSSTTYTHTFTDQNGCTNTSAAANITVNPLPTVTASNVSGCAASSIALSGTPAGGTWSVANPYTGSSTTYTHTFTDQNGCTNTSAAANITVNPLPTVTASNVSGCAASSIALSGTPAGGTWSAANPYTGSSTTYTHTFTDQNGCTNTSAAANITVNPLPTVTASNVSGCAASSIVLSGTPAGGTWSVANPYTGSSTTYTHTFTDQNGCTNTSAAANITVNPLPTVTASNVSGCAGSSIALSGTPAGGTWSVANPYTGSSTTYTHTFTDQNGCTNTSAAANITVNPLPTVSFNGLASTYNVSDPSVALTGSPSGGTFSGPGISANTFSPAIAGAGGPYTILYSYTDGNSCSNSSSQQTSVTNCVVPAKPGSITSIGGTAKMCPGDTKSYKIPAVGGAASYTWTPPAGATITTGQGTVQISVNYTANFTATGTLSVVANNSCGSSIVRTLTITRNTPATPGVIAGLAYGVCNSAGVPYSVVNVAGMTYDWSLSVTTASIQSGQGSNAVTTGFNSGYVTGSIRVSANNACGTSALRTLTVKATPATPSSITGATSVCANQFGVPYSISPVATSTSYTWTGMAGSHISDGITTSTGTILNTTATSVTVNFGSTSGILNVKAINSCGAGSNKSLTIAFTCRDQVEELSSEDFYVRAFPNPVSTELNVSFHSENNSECTLTINDVLGKTQMQLSEVAVTGENNYQLEVGKLAKGMYFLEVVNGERKKVLRIVVE